MNFKNNYCVTIAIIYTCIGYGLLSLSDTSVKFLLQSYSLFFLLFVTSFVSLFIVACFGLFKYGYLGFKTKNIKLHLVRGVAVIGTAIMNALALQKLQLDEFYAIVFITPFVLSVMSFFILKEPISKKQLYGIIAGFLCIIYMVRPGTDLFQLGSLFVFMGVIFYTINCLVTRQLRDSEKAFLLPLFSSLAIFIFALLLILLFPEIKFPRYINYFDILLIILTGVFISFGVFFITMGFYKTPSIASVAPFHYTQIIWGIILGYLIFDDIPTITTLIGATGLIITGLYVLNHERRQ